MNPEAQGGSCQLARSCCQVAPSSPSSLPSDVVAATVVAAAVVAAAVVGAAVVAAAVVGAAVVGAGVVVVSAGAAPTTSTQSQIQQWPKA